MARPVKKVIVPCGFDPRARLYNNTLVASQYNIMSKAGYTALKFLYENVTEFKNTEKYPTIEFDSKNFSAHISFTGNQINNLFFACIDGKKKWIVDTRQSDDESDSSGTEIEDIGALDDERKSVEVDSSETNTESPKKMREILVVTTPCLDDNVELTHGLFDHRHAKTIATLYQSIAFPNVNTRKKIFTKPSVECIDSWWNNGCSSSDNLGYLLENFANPDKVEADELCGCSEGSNSNTGCSVKVTFDDWFFSRFAFIVAYIGNIQEITTKKAKRGKSSRRLKSSVLQLYSTYYNMFAIPDIVDVDNFINNDFSNFVASVKYQYNEVDDPTRFVRINNVEIPESFVSTSFVIRGNMVDSYSDPFYDVMDRHYNGMLVYVYTPSSMGYSLRYLTYLSVGTHQQITFNKLNQSIKLDNNIVGKFDIGKLYENSVYHTIFKGIPFATYIVNNIDRLFMCYTKHHDITMGDIVVGDDTRIALSNALSINMVAYSKLLSNFNNSNKELVYMTESTMTSIDAMNKLKLILHGMILNYLNDSEERHGTQNAKKRLSELAYMLFRYGKRNVKNFIYTDLITKIGVANLNGINPDIITLCETMSDSELYMAVIMSISTYNKPKAG